MDIIIIFVGADALLIEAWYDDVLVNSWKLQTQTQHNMSIIDKNMNLRYEYIIYVNDGLNSKERHLC